MDYQPSFIASFGLDLIPIRMSFGFSIGDFRAATGVALNVLESYRVFRGTENEDNPDSVIILSFRSLQAQRIKELQVELYQISLEKVRQLDSAPGGSTDQEVLLLNGKLDHLLNIYGWSGALPAGLTMTDDAAAEAIRNYETLSQEALDPNSLIKSRAQSIIRRILLLPKPRYDFLEESYIDRSELRPQSSRIK